LKHSSYSYLAPLITFGLVALNDLLFFCKRGVNRKALDRVDELIMFFMEILELNQMATVLGGVGILFGVVSWRTGVGAGIALAIGGEAYVSGLYCQSQAQ